MKTIFLIGDSIRKGYDTYVEESFQGIAEVRYPAENCKFAQYILRHVHMWRDDLHLDEVDAVHWNAGLWDTLCIYGDGPLTPIELYESLLERIVLRLRFLFPNAVQIFATSTPVLEDGYIADYEMRYNADIEKYNAAAIRVMQKHGVVVNDLYALFKDRPRELHSDQTHYYTAQGTALIGGEVNRVLCRALDIEEDALKTPDADKYAITIYKNDNECYVKRGNLYEPVVGI